MSPEVRLTREMVQSVRDEVRDYFRSQGWVVGVGEFENAVYEDLANRLQLPMKDLGVAVVPDWEHPDVIEFRRQLKELKFEPEGVQNEEIREIRVPYRGIPESEFPIVRYATSLPNVGVLHDITDFDVDINDRPGYFFATLIDKDEKDVIFFGRQSHEKIREALEKTDNERLKGAKWNYAQIGLDKTTGEITNVMMKTDWGEGADKIANVLALLGKINPELFIKKEIFIDKAGGNLDFIFNPTTGEIEDFGTKIVRKVPQLY